MPVTQHLTPTLVVGVGGIGCWIADRIFEMAVESGIADSSRIAVLGFDTDENDLTRLRHLKSEQLIKTSTADTLFTVLNRRRDAIAPWFVDDTQLTTELRQMTLLDGAGAIRMLSRLSFDEALSDVYTSSRIDGAIAAIATQDNRTLFQGRVNVLLVGSLAGGTGSGMFLQTALTLGSKLRALGITPQVRGLFLLPDVVAQAARIAKDQILGVRANGYAALKELHAMTLHTQGRSARPVEFEFVRDHGLQPDGLPFASVTLMDFESQRGGNLGQNLDAYRELAARAAYTLVFTPIGGSYLSQTVNDARARLAAAATDTDNSIAGLGVSAVVYPEWAVLDYLSLRLGLSILEGDWLRLDALFRAEMERFRARVNHGETNLEPPDPGTSYIRNLDQLAESERVAFFRRIRQGVFVESTDRRGNVAVTEQHKKYLDALEKHLLDAFWNSTPDTRAARSRQDLGADALTDKDELPRDVNHYERQLRSDFAAVEKSLSTIVPELFHTSVMGAALLGDREWSDYHLESYIVRNGPHLVQVRYFLYQLRNLIQQRREDLGADRRRKAVEKNLTQAFDKPETSVVETANHIAVELSASIMPDWLDRRFRQFQGDYREHYNRTRRLIQDLGHEGALGQAYGLLEQYVARLLDVTARFFDDLDRLKDRLTLDCKRLEKAYGPGAGLADGSRYVFSDQRALESMWKDLQGGMQLLISDQEDANGTLTKALIARFREENEPNRWQVVTPFSGGALFRDAIVEGYCRQRIIKDHADLFRVPVVEAIRREAILADRDPDEHLARVIDLVSGQSSPFIAVSSPDAGQLFRFWAISSVNRDQFSDPTGFTELFTRNHGDTPVVEPEFPAHTLMCITALVNLRLSDLRKLEPGIGAHTNISAPQPGIYYAAYRDMVDRLLDHERSGRDGPSPTFTPHLDARWHRPGVLPEIHSELDEAHDRKIIDAYVLAIASGILEWEHRGDRPVTVFRDWYRRGEPDYETVLREGHDDLGLIQHLREQPAMVGAILERPSEIKQGVNPEAHRQLYEGLTSPATFGRVCRLMADRTRGEVGDALTARALEALFEHLRAAYDRENRTQDDYTRRRGFEELASALIDAADADLGQALNPDALAAALEMARGQLSRALEA